MRTNIRAVSTAHSPTHSKVVWHRYASISRLSNHELFVAKDKTSTISLISFWSFCFLIPSVLKILLFYSTLYWIIEMKVNYLFIIIVMSTISCKKPQSMMNNLPTYVEDNKLIMSKDEIRRVIMSRADVWRLLHKRVEFCTELTRRNRSPP